MILTTTTRHHILLHGMVQRESITWVLEGDVVVVAAQLMIQGAVCGLVLQLQPHHQTVDQDSAVSTAR